MAFRHVPFRAPMFDSDGRMTRIWIVFFEQLAGGVAGGATPLDVALVDGPGTTTITSAVDATEGAILAVVITQSAVGGRQIAWSAQFDSGTSVDIPMLANERVKKLFIGLGDGKWHDFAQLS